MAAASHKFGSDVLLTSREVVLIGEVVRIEEALRKNFLVEAAGSQEIVDIALVQLQGILDRLSPEDTFVWGFVEQLSEWLRSETLTHTEFGNYRLEALLAEARELKGSELTEDEINQFVVFAEELDEVRRGLGA